MSEAATRALRAQRLRRLFTTSLRVTEWTFAGLRLALLMACAFLVSWVVSYNPITWDFTEAQLFSLSAMSRSAMSALDQPVTLTAFVQGAKDPSVERLLKAYADSSALVDYRLVDPEAEPALAQVHQVRAYGMLIIEAGVSVRRADGLNEPAITNAILGATRGDAVPVCFLAGHGERIPADKGRGGFSAAVTALRQVNYEPLQLNLAAGQLVDTCRVVLIAGPTKDLLLQERAALDAYLQNGGRLLVMLESNTDLPELEALVAGYGLQVNADFVIDTGRNGQAFGLGLQVPMVDSYQPHPITDGLGAMTLFSMPRSITVGTVPEGIDARPLASSTPSSWGETDFDAVAMSRWDEGVDRRGPLPLVIAVSEALDETPRAFRDRQRTGAAAPVGGPILVAAGDVEFATNAFFKWQGNGDLFVNSVSWLAGQEELISILPKGPSNKRVLLTEGQKALTFALLVILLPAVPAVAGVFIMSNKVK
jgi:ABC-type uncharacterized transport system involved in gliding motility auxiliary subunit